MDYNAALNYLESLFSIERTPDKKEKEEVYNLKFMEELTVLLGRPQDSYPVIQVAGTNGKGSTSLFIAKILQAHGLKVGLYSSPHVCSPRERIVINGKFITESDFGRHVGRLADIFRERKGGIRTYFETLTATAFLHFQENVVDVAVLEAGLGGRLDATNVATCDVAVITKIGLDHTQTLGDTEEKILFEKLGIVKEKSKVVMTEKTDYLVTVAESILNEKQIRLNTELKATSQSTFPDPAQINIEGMGGINLPMTGEHLSENVTTAILACKSYLGEGFEKEIVADALRDAFLPVRMQRIHSKPLIILDGAHNLQAIENLLDNVQRGWRKGKYKKVHLLYGAMADKDIEGIFSIFGKYTDLAISCAPIDHMRAANIEQLRERTDHRYEYFSTAIEGLSALRQRAAQDDLILVTGSIYLVSEILQNLGACKSWESCFSPWMAEDLT